MKQPSAALLVPDTDLVLADLTALGDPVFKTGLARFGINPDNALGIKLPALRLYARAYRKNHHLAQALWTTKVHEARLMAVFIADPRQATEALLEEWASDFNSWDICDQACGCLFIKTPFAWQKAREWATREPEFEKRAAFVLLAYLAIHDKMAPDGAFLSFFPTLLQGAADERNFVKKAVNWALRQVGKRNPALHRAVLDLAREMRLQGSRSARWIAAGAIRELESPAVGERLKKKFCARDKPGPGPGSRKPEQKAFCA